MCMYVYMYVCIMCMYIYMRVCVCILNNGKWLFHLFGSYYEANCEAMTIIHDGDEEADDDDNDIMAMSITVTLNLGPYTPT